MVRKVGRPRRRKAGTKAPKPSRPRALEVLPIEELSVDLEDRGEMGVLVHEVVIHPGTGPPLTGGDLDADWQRAHLSGDEAVGGSVATPDQDVVDEIGRALGVEQASDAEVRTAEEVLHDRDRFRWHLEREGAEEEEAEEVERPRRRGKRST